MNVNARAPTEPTKKLLKSSLSLHQKRFEIQIELHYIPTWKAWSDFERLNKFEF